MSNQPATNTRSRKPVIALAIVGFLCIPVAFYRSETKDYGLPDDLVGYIAIACSIFTFGLACFIDVLYRKRSSPGPMWSACLFIASFTLSSIAVCGMIGIYYVLKTLFFYLDK